MTCSFIATRSVSQTSNSEIRWFQACVIVLQAPRRSLATIKRLHRTELFFCFGSIREGYSNTDTSRLLIAHQVNAE